MKITETVKNVSYINGKRIATIEQDISRADDYEKVGMLYLRMADIYRRLDVSDIPDREKEMLGNELEGVKKELDVYLGYLSGYSD